MCIVEATEFTSVCFWIELWQFLVKHIIFGRFIPILFLQDAMRFVISEMGTNVNCFAG
jgi:hypothetical protein